MRSVDKAHRCSQTLHTKQGLSNVFTQEDETHHEQDDDHTGDDGDDTRRVAGTQAQDTELFFARKSADFVTLIAAKPPTIIRGQ